MLKRTVEFIDFNGEVKKRDLYFNLSDPEAIRLDASLEGGIDGYVEKITENLEPELVMELFERLISESYGEKSADGLYFEKSPEKVQRFLNSAMYEALFYELVRDGEAASEFFNALVSNRGRSVVKN